MYAVRTPAVSPGDVERHLFDRGRNFVEIRLSGEIDAYDVPALRSHLEWVVARRADVLLDLSRCEFLDGAALSAIVLARRALARRGREMVGYGAGAQVGRLFEVTGLGDSLMLAPGRDGALSRLLP